MKMNLDALGKYMTELIFGGAVSVILEFDNGELLLSWKFPGNRADSMFVELEELCQSASSSC